MEVRCELLVYLERKGYLIDMRNKCSEFLEGLTEKTIRKFPPLRLICLLNVMELLDENPKLGNLLLAEPMKFINMLDDILYACLQSLQKNPLLESVLSSQVKVILRLLSVPESFVISNKRHHNGIFTFKGTLVEVTKPTHYAFHTVWSCPEECEGNEIIHSLPECAPKCCVCKRVLYENSVLRRCGEEVKAIFALENELFRKIFPITDDLILKLRLGNKYFLTGTIVKKKVYVFSVEKLETLVAPLTAPIPKEINKLFKMYAAVPWKFIYCLASMIGTNVCPQGCFMHLKIYLLMSLASVKNISKETTIMHVLVSGIDTGYATSLMCEAAKLSERSVFLGHNDSVSTALISSSGGVCVMPLPFHTYGQKQVNILRLAIESNQVPIEGSAVKLNSPVWAQDARLFYQEKKILANVSNAFGSVCRGDECEHEREIADFMLENATETPVTCNQIKHAYREIKLYLDLVIGFRVKLNDKAKEILRAYFVAARRVNSGILGTGGMITLTNLCASSAKLCHRDVASVEDAIFAVWLHADGISSMHTPSKYLEPSMDINKFHEMMIEFKTWLEEFTGLVL